MPSRRYEVGLAPHYTLTPQIGLQAEATGPLREAHLHGGRLEIVCTNLPPIIGGHPIRSIQRSESIRDL